MRSILAITAILISYGSLYPFNFTESKAFSRQFNELLSNFSIPSSSGDLFGNIVLFIPLGLVSAMIAVREPRKWTISALLFLLGTLLAFAVQVGQIWLPSRDPAAGDAVINTIGLLFGFKLGFWIDKFEPKALEYRKSVSLAPTVLCLFWIIYCWFPWVPTLDMQNIKDALKPMLATSEFSLVRSLHTAIAWIAFFKLSQYLRIKRTRPGVLTIVALAITMAQIFFSGATISVNNMAGMIIGISVIPLLSRSSSSAYVCLALLGTILITGTQPLQWAEPLNRFHWIPFTGFLSGAMSVNALVLVEKTFLYGTLIFLLHKNGAQLLPSTLLVAVWLMMIEILQIFIIGRTSEITDPVWAVLIGYFIRKSEQRNLDTEKSQSRRLESMER